MPNYDHLKISIQHAHNILLDLLLWNGVPIGVVIIASLGAWVWWLLKKANDATDIFLLLSFGTFLLHCMLELPHCKAFFLLPVAIMAGVLNVRCGMPSIGSGGQAIILWVISFFSFLLCLMWINYRKIELDLTSYRIREAGIQAHSYKPAPNIYVLHDLQEALLSIRTEVSERIDKNLLEQLRRTALRYPVESTLFRYAQAAALNGDINEAEKSLPRLCHLVSIERCSIVRSSWNEFIKTVPAVKISAEIKPDL